MLELITLEGIGAGWGIGERKREWGGGGGELALKRNADLEKGGVGGRRWM